MFYHCSIILHYLLREKGMPDEKVHAYDVFGNHIIPSFVLCMYYMWPHIFNLFHFFPAGDGMTALAVFHCLLVFTFSNFSSHGGTG